MFSFWEVARFALVLEPKFYTLPEHGKLRLVVKQVHKQPTLMFSQGKNFVNIKPLYDQQVSGRDSQVSHGIVQGRPQGLEVDVSISGSV